MRLAKLRKKLSKLDKQLLLEDLKDLQKKISGRSVYKNIHALYRRQPKHRNARYQYQD